MAYVKTDWENLPSTDTPITETALDNMEIGIEYNDQRLNGTKPMASIVVDDVSCKNLFVPTLYANGEAIAKSSAVSSLTLSGDEFTFVASGADMYFGQVRNSGEAYTNNRGVLIDVSNLSKISFIVTNTSFNLTYITAYDSSKISLGYVFFQTNEGTYTIPANAKYITFRFGTPNAVSGTTYKTKVQIEAGDTITSYTPYKNFDNTEHVLYANSTGSISQITLSDTAENYEYLEIFYKNGDGLYSSVKVYQPNNKMVQLFTIDFRNTVNQMYFKGCLWGINGNLMGPTTYANAINYGTVKFAVLDTSNNTFTTTNTMSVYRVIGIHKINNIDVSSSRSIETSGEEDR